MEDPLNDPTEDLASLTVEYWRERYAAVRTRYGTLTEIHELLASKNASFAGTNGYLRLRNIQLGKGGLHITAQATVLLEKERPDSPAPPADDTIEIIKRHGLRKT